MRSTMIRAGAAALATAVLAAAPAAASSWPASPGSDTLGDPFFPQAGNGGYDVKHYSLDLEYVPQPTNRLGLCGCTCSCAGGRFMRELDALSGAHHSRLSLC